MKILDLFCCAGGASMGLHQAFPEAEITGVDIVHQKHYPFTFVLGDALSHPTEGFDFIWASPPCQEYCTAAIKERANGKKYADLVAETREKLLLSGIPWVIENVTKAPLRKDLVLCGSHFGLKVVRHRAFEFWDARKITMPPCNHVPDVITVCGRGSPSWVMKQRISRGFHPSPSISEKRDAMEIQWTNRDELSQAIPPAYSKFIGEQIKKDLK
jgi:DNA (cytosine-5)-methyltransferase 1